MQPNSLKLLTCYVPSLSKTLFFDLNPKGAKSDLLIWVKNIFRNLVLDFGSAAGAQAQHCTGMTKWPNTIQCLG